MTGLIWQSIDNWLPAEQELVAQLAHHGYRPEDIQHVILTHLHEDHVGELYRFAGATVHLAAAEWADRARMGYSPGYAAITRWHHFTYDGGRFYSFAACADLFGDGLVIALPTPGHSYGHMSLLIRWERIRYVWRAMRCTHCAIWTPIRWRHLTILGRSGLQLSKTVCDDWQHFRWLCPTLC
ncbi:MAG: MBL fold metallo-hydrolase [Chloroflexaceae bacterium]|nr:MBL fold metallo-hydrolase [Chloroflexaceae bacterium]